MKTEQEKMTIIIFAVHSSNVSHSFYNNILTPKLTQELHNIWETSNLNCLSQLTLY
jgi:hypothetical protein